MKETALLHSMAMLLQEMLEKKEISETIFKSRINEMRNHINSKLDDISEVQYNYNKLLLTLDSLVSNEVKQLAY